MELDLGEIRKNIDAIDDQLLELFKQRMGLTRKVAEYKAAHNMVVFQSEREKAIIRSVRDRSPEELKSSAEFLFTNIMDISKCGQNNAITPRCEHSPRHADKAYPRRRSAGDRRRIRPRGGAEAVPGRPHELPRKLCGGVRGS